MRPLCPTSLARNDPPSSETGERKIHTSQHFCVRPGSKLDLPIFLFAARCQPTSEGKKKQRHDVTRSKERIAIDCPTADRRFRHFASQMHRVSCRRERDGKEEATRVKDQLTTLMEAMRLAGLEFERFKLKRQTREETLDALEAIRYDPRVRQAVQNLEPFVDSPSLVPGQNAVAPLRA